MITQINSKSSFAVFILLSMAVHLIGCLVADWFGPFALRAPIPLMPAISVSLREDVSAHQPPKPAAEVKMEKRMALRADSVKNHRVNPAGFQPLMNNPPAMNKAVQASSEAPSTPLPSPALPPAAKEHTDPPHVSLEQQSIRDVSSTVPGWPPAILNQGPVRRGEEFIHVGREKLTYRISLFGMPVGTAVMEATNANGEVRITTKIASNDVISGFYPVDDLIETRMIKGNYLLTRIRQHEGSFVGDSGFTLMLREKNAFWADRLNNRYANHQLPRSDVMDVISGFYYLRSQHLDVGTPVLLQLFDSNEYAPTSVEVLRKEHLRLPGFREVDTLVIHPLLKTAGFFKRSGDVLVWLTDDERKVPVKMETSIALGRVTAELVSAESESEMGSDKER